MSPQNIKKIQERFIAPCCWSETVAVHRSETAEEMRTEIVRMVEAGKTEQEIVDHFVAQYGEKILMEPRGGKSALLTTVPLAAGGVGLLGLTVWLYQRRKAIQREEASE